MQDAGTQSDASLVARAKNGDRAAFGQLVVRYQETLCAIAYSRLGRIQNAYDVAQESFLVGLENLQLLRSGARFGPWLRRIALRLCRQWQRQEAYRRKLKDSLRWEKAVQAAPTPEAVLQEKEDAELLDRAIARIPPDLREAIVVHYFRGQSHAETASTLGISQAAVRKRLERAKRRLRDWVISEIERGLRKARPGKEFAKRTLAAIPGGSICGKLGLDVLKAGAAETLAEALDLAAQKAGLAFTEGGSFVTAKKAIVTGACLVALGALVTYTAIRGRGQGARNTESARAPEVTSPAIGAEPERASRAKSAFAARLMGSWPVEEAEWVEYLRDLDSWWQGGWLQEVPPEFLENAENAFCHYLRAAALLVSSDSDPGLLEAERMIMQDNEWWRNPETWIDNTEKLALVRAYLQANAAALAALKAGLEKDYYAIPLVKDLGTPLPYLAKFRSLARLLEAEAYLLQADGNVWGSLEACLGLLKMGYQVGNDGAVIHGVVGQAISSIGNHPLTYLVSEVAQAPLLRDAIAELHGMRQWEWNYYDRVREDYELTVNTLCIVREVNREGIWTASDPEVERLLTQICLLPPDEFHEVTVSLRSAYPPRLDAGQLGYDELLSLPAPHSDACPLLKEVAALFDPPIRNAIKRYAMCEARLAATELLAGLKLYQLENGEFPESLRDLIPANMLEIPLDPFGGEPLKYFKTETGATVYSIGADMKDDLAQKRTSSVREEGDYVFEVR